jgi:hypothetical protein
MPDGPPKARTAAKIYEADTCVDHRRAEKLVAKQIVKNYDRSVNGSVVDVSFDCDPFTTDVDEIVVETGSGHGGGLELWRLRRERGGTDFEVLAIANHGYYTAAKAGESPVRIGRGRLSEKTLSKALTIARPALTVRIREIEPPPPPNGMWGRSFSTSSGNFHLYFRLSGGSHELVRHFTGYPGSSGQTRYLGLQAAWAALDPLLDKVPLEPSVASADEREFFVQSFLQAAPRFDEAFAWWVRERYVALAEHLGTPELVPALVSVVESGLREGERESSDERKQTVWKRRLEQPLATLARLTGWDPRQEEGGAPRDLVAAAREVLTECAVSGR